MDKYDWWVSWWLWPWIRSVQAIRRWMQNTKILRHTVWNKWEKWFNQDWVRHRKKREKVKFHAQHKCAKLLFCVKKDAVHLDSFEREEHRLRLTVTLGPRSLPRRCSGSPRSWWRPSDRVRLMSHFCISEMTRGSRSSLPAEAWPLWSRPLPRSVMESLWHSDVFSSSQRKLFIDHLHSSA